MDTKATVKIGEYSRGGRTAIRDYLNGEKVIQGFLLAYINVADYYITQSESEMNKGYSDIYMEPFLSKFPDLEYSYLIELKYISRSKYSDDILQEKIKEANEQLDQYASSDRVKNSIGNTQLKRIVLVYKWWELDYCEEYYRFSHKDFGLRSQIKIRPQRTIVRLRIILIWRLAKKSL